MEHLITLPLGVLLQLIVFMALRIGLKFAARPAALIIGLLALALYVPYAILDWPGGDVVAIHVAIFLVTAYGLGLIIANREARLQREGGSSGWFHWGPAVIIAFFVVLVLFDSVLVIVSQKGLPEPVAEWLLPRKSETEQVSTVFPGVAARDYQEKQSHFNRYLEKRRVQDQRGWQVNKGWLDAVVANRPSVFQVRVVDRNGEPVSGAEVSGSFLRLADTGLDQVFQLEEIEPGMYRQAVTLPATGVWELDMTIRKGEAVHHVRARTSVDAPGHEP